MSMVPDPDPGHNGSGGNDSMGQGVESRRERGRVIASRLWLGWVVLICAEMFSGASLRAGFWHPWTLLVTYWLYFAHFFFFTTMAVRTGRTSLSALYLWGVLFGLYEGWITKVIWHGYSGDGNFVMGALGPFGFSEISMVVLFHPVMSFMLPLAVGCILWPELRAVFPDLVLFTGKHRRGRLIRVYLVICFAFIVNMNSGGTVNLLANVVVVVAVFWLLRRRSRGRGDVAWAEEVIVFGRRGFVGLCGYLAVLYGVTYVYLRPDGLPSVGVQLFTMLFYLLAGLGLWLLPRREPVAAGDGEGWEWRRVRGVFVGVTGLALLLTLLPWAQQLGMVVAVHFLIWTPLGWGFLCGSLWTGVRYQMTKRGGGD